MGLNPRRRSCVKKEECSRFAHRVPGWRSPVPLTFGSPARGVAGPWVENAEARARLIGDARALGLEFELQPGWHVYWKNSGDAGYAPRIDFSATSAIRDARLLFPAPRRFELAAGMVSFGYERTVLYPIAATFSPPAGRPLGGDRAPRLPGLPRRVHSAPRGPQPGDPGEDRRRRPRVRSPGGGARRAAAPGWRFAGGAAGDLAGGARPGGRAGSRAACGRRNLACRRHPISSSNRIPCSRSGGRSSRRRRTACASASDFSRSI